MLLLLFLCIFPMLGFNCIFRQMKDKPKVPMPGSRLNDPTPGELRGDPGLGDSKREAEPSAPNLTPTVLDTVGSVGMAEQLGRNQGRKKSSSSTLTSLENSGLPLVVVQGLRGSPCVCDVGQDGNKGHAPDAALKLVVDFTRLSCQGQGGFFLTTDWARGSELHILCLRLPLYRTILPWSW